MKKNQTKGFHSTQNVNAHKQNLDTFASNSNSRLFLCVFVNEYIAAYKWLHYLNGGSAIQADSEVAKAN